MKNLKNKKMLLVTFMIIGSVLLLTGCNKQNNEPVPTNTDTKTEEKYFSVSTTNLTIPVGSTETFDITLKNAVGRVDVTSNDTSIALVDEEKLWIEGIGQKIDKATVTVTGNEVGETQIIVNLADVAAFDTEEEITGSYTINVTVK